MVSHEVAYAQMVEYLTLKRYLHTFTQLDLPYGLSFIFKMNIVFPGGVYGIIVIIT